VNESGSRHAVADDLNELKRVSDFMFDDVILKMAHLSESRVHVSDLAASLPNDRRHVHGISSHYLQLQLLSESCFDLFFLCWSDESLDFVDPVGETCLCLFGVQFQLHSGGIILGL